MRGYLGTSLHANAIYLILTHLTAAGSGFIFWVAVARLAPSSEVGIASAAIAAVMLVASISTLGIPYALVRFLPGAADNAGNLINFGIVACGSVAGLAAMVYLAGVHWWTPSLVLLRQDPAFVVSFILFSISVTLGPLLLFHIFAAYRRARYAFTAGVVEALVKIAAVGALAVLLGTLGVFAAWGLSHLIALLFAVSFLLPRVQSDYHPRLVLRNVPTNNIVRFSLTNIVSDLAWFTPGSGLVGWILPIVVVNLLGAEQNAHFYISWLTVAAINSVPVAAATSLFAEGSLQETRVYEYARQGLKFALLLLLPLIAIILLFGDKLLLVYGRTYSENAGGLLQILSLAALPLAFNVISLGIWKVQRNLKMILALGILIAGITFGLTYALADDLGLLSPGVAWLTSQCVGVVALSWLAWWKKPMARRLRSPTTST
jgi:O-antigen/teichoic acid export membrane protein